MHGTNIKIIQYFLVYFLLHEVSLKDRLV